MPGCSNAQKNVMANAAIDVISARPSQCRRISTPSVSGFFKDSVPTFLLGLGFRARGLGFRVLDSRVP